MPLEYKLDGEDPASHLSIQNTKCKLISLTDWTSGPRAFHILSMNIPTFISSEVPIDRQPHDRGGTEQLSVLAIEDSSALLDILHASGNLSSMVARP